VRRLSSRIKEALALQGRLITAACLALGLAACRPAPTPAPAARPAPQVAAAPGAAPTPSATLLTVRARGRLLCGVQDDLPGFADRDVLGQWKGFDIDICRAVAAAVFGDARAVGIVPVDAKARFTALQAGQVDMLARGGTWTFTRDAGLGVDFAGVSYYDGQGFLVRDSLKVARAADLGEARICVEAGTNAELNLIEYLRTSGSRARAVLAESADDARASYEEGRCEALSSAVSYLASVRTRLRREDEHVILPDLISKEPFGPVVRQGDSAWADVVRWSLDAMILAEELGLDSANVAEARSNPAAPEVGRLLKGDGYGGMLSLRDDWAFQIVRQVGSYSQVFERNLGPDTALKLERGRNALWNAETPGLLYAPPMR
jgi:general L-amino acid transport system substrate-binding protein